MARNIVIFINYLHTFRQAKVALNKLLDMGAQTVIITLGSQGAVYVCGKETTKYFHVHPYKIAKVVDTTGAGDAFLGALAFHLAKLPQQELSQHIGFANYVAAFSVQFPGTQASFPKENVFLETIPQTFTYTQI